MVLRSLYYKARQYRHYLKAKAVVPDPEWVRAISEHHAPIDLIEWDAPTGDILLRIDKTRIPRRFMDLCVPELKRMDTLIKLGGKFRFENDDLICEFNKARMCVQTREELFILEELYVHGCYDLHMTGNPLILDIGMNVGYASLMFAACMPTAQIVGYELMPPTYEAAAKNLALNPELASRIETHCVGVSDHDQSMTLDYNPVWRGSIGLYTAPSWVPSEFTTQMVEVKVRDAADLFAEAAAKYPDRPILLKIDCEGEEYRIVRRLREAGHLNRVFGVLMEWHCRHESHDTVALRRDLDETGFSTLFMTSLPNQLGMLYGLANRETVTTM